MLDSDTYRLPRTVIVASTLPAINAIANKVKSVMRTLRTDDKYPGLAVPEPNRLPVVYSPASSLEWVEQELETFSSGASPILICDPVCATQFLDGGIEHIWWLNLKVKEKAHLEAIQQMLGAIGQCDGHFQTKLTITICFGADDNQEAATVKNWLQSHMGETYNSVSGLGELQKHFG
jgi:hypothetical protein